MKDMIRQVEVDLNKILPTYEELFDKWVKTDGVDDAHLLIAVRICALNEIGVLTDEETDKIKEYFIDKVLTIIEESGTDFDKCIKMLDSIDAYGFDWREGDFVCDRRCEHGCK